MDIRREFYRASVEYYFVFAFRYAFNRTMKLVDIIIYPRNFSENYS